MLISLSASGFFKNLALRPAFSATREACKRISIEHWRICTFIMLYLVYIILMINGCTCGLLFRL